MIRERGRTFSLSSRTFDLSIEEASIVQIRHIGCLIVVLVRVLQLVDKGVALELADDKAFVIGLKDKDEGVFV